MSFARDIQKIYETKWSYINTFDLRIFNIHEKTKAAIGWDQDVMDRDLVQYVVSVDTPQFTNQPIEVFVANKWVIGNGRDELYRFSITFRDFDQMKLYRKFVQLYQRTREDYFDHVKFTVQLAKDGDYYGQNEQKLFDLENTIVESVSQLQFNNTTENQIAEFTVNFKTTTPTLAVHEANATATTTPV
jgi:hypothetical protein